MDLLRDTLQYVQDNPEKCQQALSVHLRLSVSSLVLAILVFLPLGVVAARSARVGPTLLGVVAAVRVIPSLAVLFLLYPYLSEIRRMIPFLQPTYALALLALTVLAGPPLVINTDAGLRNVDAAVLENARGLGMSPAQVFFQVQFPLALPVVIAGIRTAAVEIVASATLAAFIGVGGLGTFITSGVTLLDNKLLLVGAIPVTLLALLAETVLGTLERIVAPPAA
ncbi:MAG: ABC transporter permease [Chloroflexota bacterium]|nr:ABC transporter permease [Chloroflexota bacterium]